MFEFFKNKNKNNKKDNVNSKNSIIKRHGSGNKKDGLINNRKRAVKNEYKPHFKIELDEYNKRISSLTGSEYKVYKEIVQGYSTEETSERTKLKISTIKSYQKSIYKKLEVHSKVELITIYATIYDYLNDISEGQQEEYDLENKN